MRRVKARVSIFLIIILFACLGVAGNELRNKCTFKASLSGDEEVPPVKTKAKGETKFQVNKEGNKLTYNLIISNIKDITAAYVQKGKNGENGPPVVNLFAEPKRENVSGTFLSEGKVEPYLLIGPLKGKSLESLIQFIEAGETYVNIRTKRYPDGEIRGQIK